MKKQLSLVPSEAESDYPPIEVQTARTNLYDLKDIDPFKSGRETYLNDPYEKKADENDGIKSSNSSFL